MSTNVGFRSQFCAGINGRNRLHWCCSRSDVLRRTAVFSSMTFSRRCVPARMSVICPNDLAHSRLTISPAATRSPGKSSPTENEKGHNKRSVQTFRDTLRQRVDILLARAVSGYSTCNSCSLQRYVPTGDCVWDESRHMGRDCVRPKGIKPIVVVACRTGWRVVCVRRGRSLQDHIEHQALDPVWNEGTADH